MSECSCCVDASTRPSEAQDRHGRRTRCPGVELALADDGELLVRGGRS